MDEERRRAYLRAMGIALWLPRGQAEAPAALPAGALDQGASGSPQGPDRRLVECTVERIRIGPQTPGPGLAPGDPAGMDWDALAESVRACRACPLRESRTQTVFGVGNRQADLLAIGEAPGADEDREGEPFVGRAGQLLDRMLGSIGLSRGQVYIANVLKCRPPRNRDPSAEEALRCRAFLTRQIELVGPRVILALGRISAQSLLHTDVAVGRLRGRWHALGPDSIPLRVTYHPAYLLRSPAEKAKAWEDLCAVARQLRDPD